MKTAGKSSLSDRAPLACRRRRPIAPFRYARLDGTSPKPDIDPGFDDSSWPVIEPDSYWGDWRTDFVLRTRFAVPSGWGDNGPVALHLPLGTAGDFFCHPEALAYLDWVPLHGLVVQESPWPIGAVGLPELWAAATDALEGTVEAHMSARRLSLSGNASARHALRQMYAMDARCIIVTGPEGAQDVVTPTDALKLWRSR